MWDWGESCGLTCVGEDEEVDIPGVAGVPIELALLDIVFLVAISFPDSAVLDLSDMSNLTSTGIYFTNRSRRQAKRILKVRSAASEVLDDESGSTTPSSPPIAVVVVVVVLDRDEGDAEGRSQVGTVKRCWAIR